MSVSTTANRAVATANGTQTAFPFPYLFYSNSDLQVYVGGVLQTSGFTVTGAGVQAGGTVTFTVAPANLAQVLILRVVPQTQAVVYGVGGAFPAKTHETALDRAVMMVQQMQETLGRSVTIPITSTLSGLTIPDPALPANAGKFYRVKADNSGIEVVAGTGADASLLSTKGDLLSYASAPGRLGVGADGQTLEADSTASFGLTWKQGLRNLLTAKGDILAATGPGSAVKKAVGPNGNVLTADSSQSDGLAWTALSLIGQCRLGYVSATQIKLSPFMGRFIPVKGAGGSWEIRSIGTGIIANNTSVYVGGVAAQNLAASTLYYVYAFDNAGTLTIDFRTTVHATDATTGVEIASGLDTRTLVGMVYTNASSQFDDSAGLRHVASWFNQQAQSSTLGLGANTSTASTAWVEIDTTLRPSFLVWAGRRVWLTINGSTSSSASPLIVLTAVSLDSSATPLASSNSTSPAANAPMPIGLMVPTYPSEGRHYVSLLASVNGGTGTWLSGDAAAAQSGKVRVAATVDI